MANARFLKVTLNGQMIHKDLEVPQPTPGGLTITDLVALGEMAYDAVGQVCNLSRFAKRMSGETAREPVTLAT